MYNKDKYNNKYLSVLKKTKHPHMRHKEMKNFEK